MGKIVPCDIVGHHVACIEQTYGVCVRQPFHQQANILEKINNGVHPRWLSLNFSGEDFRERPGDKIVGVSNVSINGPFRTSGGAVVAALANAAARASVSVSGVH